MAYSNAPAADLFGGLNGLEQLHLQTRPEYAWDRIVRQASGGDMESPLARWAKGLYGDALGVSTQRAFQNPGLRQYDALADYAGQKGGLLNRWLLLSAEERGERPEAFRAGRFLG